MVQSDHWIREMALQGMIEPFVPEQVSEGVISYGLSSYGYDIRVADEFKILSGRSGATLDPKEFDPSTLVDFKGPSCTIPAHSFALARSVEYLRIPREILGLVVGKSSYARCGIFCHVTPLEPGWCGHITIGIYNLAPLPARVYAHEGIAQVIFLQASEPCQVSYEDRQGKYQDQRGIVLPKVERGSGPRGSRVGRGGGGPV
jgi:dCTP deaminase